MVVPKEEWGKLHIAKINGWTLGLCGDQHVLGWLIIFPPRNVEGSLTSLTDTELVEFKKVGIIAEKLLKNAFNAEWFNYSQAGNVVRNLHIHLQPRYSSPREFKGATFTDEGWGHPIKSLSPDKLVSRDKAFEIVNYLKLILKDINTEGLEVEIL